MKQSKHLIQTIRNWYSSHNPSDDAKWCIQNLLGDYYGWGSEEQKEITEIMSPINDKPEGEYLFISRKGMAKLGVEPQGNGLISEKLGIKTKPECECEKTSNEWKIYSLNSDGQCIHCGRQISPKQEKIEPSNIDFKSKTDWQGHFIMLENKINELIKAVNSLKGE